MARIERLHSTPTEDVPRNMLYFTKGYRYGIRCGMGGEYAVHIFEKVPYTTPNKEGDIIC